MAASVSWSYPMQLQLGTASISLHGLLEAIGIFVAFRYYLSLRKQQGDTISSENRIWIVIAAALGAVLGARIVGALENLPQWVASPDKLAYFWGNKTLVGGLLGGLAGVEFTKKIIGERHRSGDLFVYPLLLGMLIGRIGCFTTGIYEETYGLPTSLPWAMDLGDGIMRHPVVLYEIPFLLLLWIGIAYLRKLWIMEEGAAFKIFMIAYLLFRFLLDFIKPGWRYALGLGTIQLSCLAGLIYYSRYLIQPRLLLAQTTHTNAP
jgi:phosphatidylglycerol---prolipoprotein diacylglyceryl transferase